MEVAGGDSTMNMRDEAALIAAARSLDHGALTAIFDDYAPAIYKYLLRLGVNSKEADEIVGDVFARLLDKFAKGEGPRTNLRSYLFQTAYHIVVDLVRERQRTAPLDVVDTLKEDKQPVQALPEEKMLLEYLSTAIEQELTEDQRNVLILRFQEEFSLKETAEIVQKNVNAVKAIQNRAINNLREAFRRDFGE
jgi:RNA polymerase sigma-70 factor (ECF subfamily)